MARLSFKKAGLLSPKTLREEIVQDIDQMDQIQGENLAVDDVVVLTSDGVRAYDEGGGDTVDMQFGRVFATGTRASAETANKVAVLRYK